MTPPNFAMEWFVFCVCAFSLSQTLAFLMLIINVLTGCNVFFLIIHIDYVWIDVDVYNLVQYICLYFAIPCCLHNLN